MSNNHTRVQPSTISHQNCEKKTPETTILYKFYSRSCKKAQLPICLFSLQLLGFQELLGDFELQSDIDSDSDSDLESGQDSLRAVRLFRNGGRNQSS
jgi:hypothetical protein